LSAAPVGVKSLCDLPAVECEQTHTLGIGVVHCDSLPSAQSCDDGVNQPNHSDAAQQSWNERRVRKQNEAENASHRKYPREQ
jgi:hypothetical protein